MVATCAQKRGAGHALSDIEPEHAVVERDRSFEVGDFQVDVSDIDLWMDWPGHDQ
jgi:hypothetical protein